MQSLDIISVNIWQMLISLINLLLLFLMIKKFLYKPVKKMLETRQSTIDGEYEAASLAKSQAISDKEQYEEKLSTAKSEADRIIKSAVDIANKREKDIIDDAKKKADIIVTQAHSDAVLERKKAEESIKKEIVEVSAALTEKLLEREVSLSDHKQLIDSFVDEIGGEDDAD